MSVIKSKEELERRNRARKKRREQKPKCCDDGKNYKFEGDWLVKKKKRFDDETT